MSLSPQLAIHLKSFKPTQVSVILPPPLLEKNLEKKLARGKSEGLQIQSSASCRVMLILNAFHSCPLPEALRQLQLHLRPQKGQESCFSIAKTNFLPFQQLCMPSFSFLGPGNS